MRSVRFFASLLLVAAGCSGGAQVQPNKAPTVTVTIEPSAPSTTDTLNAAAIGMDPEGTDVEFTYEWTKDGRSAGTGATIAPTQTERGEVWKVMVVGSDGRTDSEPAEAEVTIGNAAPMLASLSLGPDPALASDELVVTPGATSDADDDAVMVTYRWMADGVMVAEGIETTLPAGTLTNGQSIAVIGTPNDGTDDGAPVTSNTIVIGNSAPTISGVAIQPTTGGVEDPFVCTPQGWMDADGDPEGYDFVWTINGMASVVTTATITSGYVRDDILICTATPNDGKTTGPPMTSRPAAVVNTPPLATAVVISPTAPIEGDTMTATISGAFDADGDNVGFQYQWRVNMRTVSVMPTIASDVFAKGDLINLIVTPTDGFGNGTFLRSNTATVGNSPPSAVSAAVDPTPPVASAPLVARVDGWTDADAADIPNYEYQWYVNAVAIPGAVGTTLDPAQFMRGDMVYFEATPFDGTDRGPLVTAPAVTIANAPPGAPTITITPVSPTHADNLVCTISTPSVDADGDVVTYTYSWTRNGLPTTITSSTALRAMTNDRDDWACVVVPNDGAIDGPSASGETTIAPACDSLSFDGVDDYASVPTNAALNYGPTATVEAWVRYDGTARAQVSSQIFGHAPASAAMQIGVFQSDTTTGTQCAGRAAGQAFFSFNAAAGGCINATNALAADTWNHIAGVYGPGGASLYVNGELVASNAAPPAIAAGGGTTPVGIGGFAGGAANGFFGGAIAEVRVSSNARYGAPFVPTRRLAADIDTVASWRFDDGVGATSVGEGTPLTATINGATWITQGPTCEFDPQAIAEVYANRSCQFTARCEPALFGFFRQTEPECRADRLGTFSQQYGAIARMISAGRVSFSQVQFDACIAANRNVDCETQFEPSACDFLNGQQLRGQACSSSVECATIDYCNNGAALACGTCVARAQDQADCSLSLCRAGSQCLGVGAQQLCINFRNNVGATCGTVATGLCRGRLQCVLPGTTAPGSCRRPAPAGAACNASAQMGTPGCNIYVDQTCDGGTCRAVTWTAPASACNATAQCDSRGTCTAGSCLAWPAAGAACNNSTCNDQAFCNNANQCVARLANGAMCTASAACQDGFVCQGGTCQRFDWMQCN